MVARTLLLQLLRGQTSGKGLVAAFTGINDRDQALALGGYTLFISRDQLPAPQDGEYYWADLIGLRVENRQGITLGRVSELFETGANDILVVKTDNSKAEILIPFVRPRYVEAIDLANGLMRVDWETEWSQVAPTTANKTCASTSSPSSPSLYATGLTKASLDVRLPKTMRPPACITGIPAATATTATSVSMTAPLAVAPAW